MGQTLEVSYPSLAADPPGRSRWLPQGMGTVVPGRGTLPSGASLIQQPVGGGFVHPSTLLSGDLSLFPAMAWQRVGVGLAQGHDGFRLCASGAVAAPSHPSVLPAVNLGTLGVR